MQRWSRRLGALCALTLLLLSLAGCTQEETMAEQLSAFLYQAVEKVETMLEPLFQAQ